MIFANLQNLKYTSVLIVLIICSVQKSHGQSPAMRDRGFECGVLSHELLSDMRIFTSFVAGIFIKQQNFQEPFKFWLSGTIIGPTTVLTIWGGAYGSLLRDKREKYKIPRPENFFIAAGINSSDIFSSDQYMQIRNVEYIIPHADENPNNHGFHLVIFHTKTPFDFNSPLVKPICLPSTVILPEQESHFIAGFEFSPKVHKISRTQLFALEPSDECQKAFWYYYRANSSHILCAKPLKDFHEDYCVSHGSGLTFLIQGKYYLGGVVALIPSKRGNVCKDNSVYFFSSFTSAEESEQITWMNQNLECSPKGFPCKRGPCVPLSKVCDHIVDCPEGDDESGIFCDAATYCEKEKYIACGLKDSCIGPGQVCDGAKDCNNNLDESTFFCGAKASANASGLDNKSLYKDYVSTRKPTITIPTTMTCEEIQVSHGVRAKCMLNNQSISCDSATVGTQITLSCKPYYLSKFRQTSIQMTCDNDGKWKPYRSFGCEAECGRVDFLGGNYTPFIANGQSAITEYFPWYVAIFLLNDGSGRFDFVCGGTLIENQVIVTAAHCFRNEMEDSQDYRKYRVILGAESSRMSENQKINGAIITGINGVWTPPTFDDYSLKSDLALARLDISVEYSKKIRPVCYLTKNEFPLPPPGTLGVLAGFGKDENGLIPPSLKWANFPVAPNDVCEKTLELSVSSAEFCAGFANGTAACEGDSGGGIMFRKKSKDPASPLVLKGVVSRGVLTKESTCNTHNVAVFTLLDSFSDWMFDVLETMDVA